MRIQIKTEPATVSVEVANPLAIFVSPIASPHFFCLRTMNTTTTNNTASHTYNNGANGLGSTAAPLASLVGRQHVARRASHYNRVQSDRPLAFMAFMPSFTAPLLSSERRSLTDDNDNPRGQYHGERGTQDHIRWIFDATMRELYDSTDLLDHEGEQTQRRTPNQIVDLTGRLSQLRS